MQTNLQIKISTTMSYALRHYPDKFDIILDEYGFVDLETFINSLRKFGGNKCSNLKIEDVKEIVKTCPKQRYEIVNNKIRAKGGHNERLSKIKKEPIIPPDILYHGTTPENAKSILLTGLKSMERQNCNMSSDVETAIIVGKRRCTDPVILIIDAKRAYEDKIEFYLESINTYASIEIPAKYISEK